MPDQERRKPRHQTINDLPSKTVQSDRNQSDIKAILRRYNATGIVDHLNRVEGVFMDISEFTDFRDMQLQTKEAEKAFMQLPSKAREVFDHDVYTWLDYAHDPEKRVDLIPKLQALGFDTPGGNLKPTPTPPPADPPKGSDPPPE